MNSLKSITFPSRNYLAVVAILMVILMVLVACGRSKYPMVTIKTEMGDIEVEVYADQAPVTASNFLSLVRDGIYTNTLFYRVVRMDNQPTNDVKIEVIQGGLFHDDQVDKYIPIKHETTKMTGIKHTNGVISMARNEPGSASTEFFICLGDQPSLDFGGSRNPDGAGFAAFGKVIKGMEVVRTIQALPDSNLYLQTPVEIREMIVNP